MHDHLQRIRIIFCLVLAGELIFSLPFHVTRFFRPTLLSVFELSNAGLGSIFAVFGITATIVYFPGGAIADCISARKLMSVSLFATALGGLYFAQIPEHTGLLLLYGYWGITSIFLFWSAMIKATRDLSSSTTQGSAFGILDGGRGLVAAGAAYLAVKFVFSVFLPTETINASESEREIALRSVIYFYSLMTCLAGLIVWFFVPDTQHTRSNAFSNLFQGVSQVIKRKVIWLQAMIVVCAYCAYKGLDNYGLYAVDVLDMNELESAEFTSYSAFLRPISAIAAGFIADRFTGSKVITSAFALLILAYTLLFLYLPDSIGASIIVATLIVSFSAVYALRGVYFVLLEESKVSGTYTGTAVGLISLVGFTPDIFFAPIAGYILDTYPGTSGHQYFFLMMVGIAIAGLLTSWQLGRSIAKK